MIVIAIQPTNRDRLFRASQLSVDGQKTLR
jgi:hypothetical protein